MVAHLKRHVPMCEKNELIIKYELQNICCFILFLCSLFLVIILFWSFQPFHLLLADFFVLIDGLSYLKGGNKVLVFIFQSKGQRWKISNQISRVFFWTKNKDQEKDLFSKASKLYCYFNPNEKMLAKEKVLSSKIEILAFQRRDWKAK